MTGAGAGSAAGPAERLYTPEILALAVSLGQWPLDRDYALVGEARSRSCGSTLTLGLALGSDNRIAQHGLRLAACAIGQASAALFAQAAIGTSAGRVIAVAADMERWVRGDGEMPEWPGLTAIAPAIAYPGRHGAILMVWEAAGRALSNAGSGR